MFDARVEISRDEVIAYAAEQGVTLSQHQLVRWHKAGLLPRPHRVHLGRGKGTVSMYPQCAANTAVVLAIAKRERRSLEQMAWAAWTLEYPVTSKIRELLIRNFEAQIAAARATLEAFELGTPGNAIDAAEKHSLWRGAPRTPREFRPTIVRIFTEVMADQFDAELYDGNDLSSAFLQSRTPSRHAVSIDATLMRDLLTRFLSPLNAVKALDAARRLSDEQLEADRAIAKAAWTRIWKRAERDAPLLPFGLFQVVFTVRRTSSDTRWALAWGTREVRRQGFASIGEFFDHMQRSYDESRRQINVHQLAI